MPKYQTNEVFASEKKVLKLFSFLIYELDDSFMTFFSDLWAYWQFYNLLV